MSEILRIPGNEIPAKGEMKAVSIGDREILLANAGGTYYAIDNSCPHLKGRLSEGSLDEYTVTCPKHGSQFDIRTGENIRWLKGTGVTSTIAKMVKPPRSVKSHIIEQQGDDILIEIE